jgi:hypothetical protein
MLSESVNQLEKIFLFSDSSIISAGSSTGAFLGFEFLDGIWKLSSFDIKENAFSLCTFTSKITILKKKKKKKKDNNIITERLHSGSHLLSCTSNV